MKNRVVKIVLIFILVLSNILVLSSCNNKNLRNEFIKLASDYHNGEDVTIKDFFELLGKKNCYVQFNGKYWVTIKEWEELVKNNVSNVPSKIEDIENIKWCGKTALINNVIVKMDFIVIWNIKINFHLEFSRFLIEYAGSIGPVNDIGVGDSHHYKFYKQNTKYAFENIYTPNYMSLREDIIFNKVIYTKNEVVDILNDEFLYQVVYEVEYIDLYSNKHTTNKIEILDIQYNEIYNIDYDKLLLNIKKVYDVDEDYLINIKSITIQNAYIYQVSQELSVNQIRLLSLPISWFNEDIYFNSKIMLLWVELIYPSIYDVDNFNTYYFKWGWEWLP